MAWILNQNQKPWYFDKTV